MIINHANLSILNQAFNTRSTCQRIQAINWWVATIKCTEGDFQQQLSPEEKQKLASQQRDTLGHYTV